MALGKPTDIYLF